MNFEDDDLDIGYVPTIGSGSRSSSMKKLTRKTDNKAAPKKQISKKQQDDFDLLDDLLGPQVQVKKSKATSVPKKTNYGNDSIDSFFDQPSNINSKNNSFNKPASKTNTINYSAQKQPELVIDNPIIEETSKGDSMFKLKRPDTAISINKSKVEDEDSVISMSPSIRNMKPPLRRRQSRDSVKQQKSALQIKPEPSKISDGGLNLSFTNQINLSSTKPKQQQELPNIGSRSRMMKPPLTKKRSSMELTLEEDGDKKTSNLGNTTNQKQSLNKQPSYLTLQESVTVQQKKEPFKISKNTERSKSQIKQTLKLSDQPQKTLFSKPAHHQQKITFQPQTRPQTQNKYSTQKQSLQPPPKLNTINTQFNQMSVSIPQDYGKADAQKELQFVKRNYQKHIDTLQKNLQDQIKSNKETRQRLMKEASSMVESQRRRLQKIHEEQLQRVKQMGEWQKKKVQENYKSQIASLKSQVEHQSKISNSENITQNKYSSLDIDKKQIQYLEDKLRAQRKVLEDRQKILDRREMNIDERQRQLNKRKRLDQERLRDEQKRIFQYEIDAKKHIVDQKRKLQQQKQMIATQMAQIELGTYKKNQNISQLAAELETRQRQLQKQKQQFRKMNRKLIQQVRQKEHILKQQKDRLARTQTDLIHKIRVVQAKAAKDNTQYTTFKTLKQKQNTWVDPVQTLELKRPQSAQRADQEKKIQTTQHRFYNISQNIKQSLRPNTQGNFDIDKYMMSMAKYTRNRQQYK